MIIPAANPATKAPRKPDFPFAAIAPPTKPTTSPGRSAIAIAIKPASTGSIKPNASPPMDLKNAAAGRIVPKLARSSVGSDARSTPKLSIKNAMAIMIPPPTTNGSIWETPFIRCL